MSWFTALAGPAARRALKIRVFALWKLLRHADTPWPSKAVAGLVLLYALSPIDLIPDFIPVLGLLDELLLLPLGLALAVALAPKPLWQACLTEAQQEADSRNARAPKWRAGAVFIVLIWLLLGGLALGWWWSGRA
ncbi:DUF1232 domain-containing protein [Piscinibacter sp. Jin2]|uniref:DUF1232 domain-containing protein n=1 Tax=Aquariibacter lacus TaxID=2801332 RepID=A0A9X1BN25_9BURK|nr:DUF1232 domain-containing protein [Piscinibacter lacus]MBL0719072.1 DUF1232 domain-containing protein [Piscinibacter lacus]